ncbi:MAG: excinuclease ABC subunit UvrA [Spirochaetales bacterium]|nr:excinuclease ABC subunit UvrA [Spirochaetales bacterium]
MEKIKAYHLRKIGLIEAGNNEARCRILLDDNYIRGLRQLEHFSHLHVFAVNGQQEVGHFITDIIRINQKAGIIETGPGLPGGAILLDLKPYMPSEDRFTKDADVAGAADLLKLAPKIVAEKDGLMAAVIGRISINEGRPRIILDDPAMLLSASEAFNGYVNILWYFSRSNMEQLRKILVCRPPYDAPETGVFACRSPVRPNPLGFTTVKVEKVDSASGVIEIDDTDAFEGTPVLALEVYKPEIHRIDACRLPKWLSHWPKQAGGSLQPAFSGRIKPADIRRLESELPRGEPAEERPAVSGAFGAGHGRPDRIELVGVRQNNLKNIDVSIPVNALTVITGVSGSGKSSLAFDTLYAESRRRFVQSMSAASRSASEQLEKPDVDRISNLFPAIAVDQKNISRNPRSTVGSISEVYGYLRTLFARFGTRYCSFCGSEIKPVSAGKLAEIISNLAEGAEVLLLPGREVLSGKTRSELTEIFHQAYESGSGFIGLEVNGAPVRVTDRTACTGCDRIVMKMSPSIFSYNSPSGMCRTCSGLGRKLEVDPVRVINKPHLSLLDGASPWYGDLRTHMQNMNANWMRGEIVALADKMRVDLEIPWQDLPEDFRQAALYGSGDTEFTLTYSSKKTGRTGTIKRPVGGSVNHIKRLFSNSSSGNSHELYKQFLTEVECPDCGGQRLAPEGRFVFLTGKSYPEAASMSISEALSWADEVARGLDPSSASAAGMLIFELKKHLEALIGTGLHYLTLDRPVTTISGGEGQRIKLAGQLGCGLSGLLYILDEPSIGLHPRDHQKVIEVMKELRDEGNTIVVVEHDAQTILAADYLIDIGPGAGAHGGKLVAEGSPEQLMANPESVTGPYLSGIKTAVPDSTSSTLAPDAPFLRVMEADLNNLRGLDVWFPAGKLSCVTGVSGSGKTSLVLGILVPRMLVALKNGEVRNLEGVENVDRVIHVDQSPIGRSSRSVPATYIGFFDEIRNLFARTPEAKKRKYKAGRFSFNDKAGRCSACEGLGKSRIDMSFLPDTWMQCPECGGRRYNAETLEVRLAGKTIFDVLEMDVLEALDFFSGVAGITSALRTMSDVGLEYLKLGQSSATLSGGEAQRIKLASELQRTDNGRTLYIFDEPTTGLHFSDIEKLCVVFRRLTDAGNTVIIIEHNLDIIRSADWIVDLGPEGGEEGGDLIGQGSPAEIAGIPESYTGSFLKSIV